MIRPTFIAAVLAALSWSYHDPDIRATAETPLLLVTHGDVASTLICGSKGEHLSRHREVGALATAELRAVDWPRVV